MTVEERCRVLARTHRDAEVRELLSSAADEIRHVYQFAGEAITALAAGRGVKLTVEVEPKS